MSLPKNAFVDSYGPVVVPYVGDLGDVLAVIQHYATQMGDERWTYHWHGPNFKPVNKYLTSEGYPLGTTCWYVAITYRGYHENICADTMQDAVIKAHNWIINIKD